MEITLTNPCSSSYSCNNGSLSSLFNLAKDFFSKVSKKNATCEEYLTKYLFEINIPTFINIDAIELSADDSSTIPERIEQILSFYGFGKSFLCKIVGVSRTSLYAWLDETKKPDEHNAKKIGQLYSIIRKVNASKNDALYFGYAEKPEFSYPKSLYEFLSEENLNEDLCLDYTNKLFQKSKERKQTIEKIKQQSSAIVNTEDEKELNLLNNLQDDL